MSKKQRIRRIGSISDELLYKSREAALAAVQIFNNPQILFKSEIFIVAMCIAWTYLLHAYYRKNKIEYRYHELVGTRRIFDKTKYGAYKHWELEHCLNDSKSPIDKDTANNLRFLIGLRHEIEHQMTTRIDNYLSARFQSCCLNFNDYIKELFGTEKGIDKHLSFSLQFSSITEHQADTLSAAKDLPNHLERFIEGFDGQLSDEEFNHPRFGHRVLFVAKTANRKGQADQVIEFVRADSELAENVNKTYTVIKETERPKFLPTRVVNIMQAEGFTRFLIYHHTKLWKKLEAKNSAKGFGALVDQTWYWYESWVEEVRRHCQQSKDIYK